MHAKGILHIGTCGPMIFFFMNKNQDQEQTRSEPEQKNCPNPDPIPKLHMSGSDRMK